MGNTLANLHTGVDGTSLLLAIGGRANDTNAILLFIDSKDGGAQFISNNLITSGGEEGTINNLGVSESDGMRFENGFQPDYAIRIQGNPGQRNASLIQMTRQETQLIVRWIQRDSGVYYDLEQSGDLTPG